jgi:hypothetical protein
MPDTMQLGCQVCQGTDLTSTKLLIYKDLLVTDLYLTGKPTELYMNLSTA